jgi:hypothetical protein
VWTQGRKVHRAKGLSLEQRLLKLQQLDKSKNMQLHATTRGTVEEILAGVESDLPAAAVEEGRGCSPQREEQDETVLPPS